MSALHPDAPLPENVVTLHPDGIFIREECDVVWIERRRGSRGTAAVAYTLDELVQLRDRLGAFLDGAFPGGRR